jgi:hypothetical protein
MREMAMLKWSLVLALQGPFAVTSNHDVTTVTDRMRRF